VIVTALSPLRQGGVMIATAVTRPLVSRVFASGFFLFIALSWDFFGGFLGTYWGVFSFGLALQNSIREE